jgi:hypothetical protein
MLHWTGAADKDVIKVAEGEIQSGQHLVHEPLERLTGVAQPKRHL